ncbi:MAG TPA: hypothetical protein PLH91_10335 [Tenuifilaceae bacterium]|nr:hypothetical protein [Tenuifilaceae bacterium]HPI45619.1 hypothetical protein [Tenuifilaceae bacterium]HPN21962.1 hypothetical protein [Tenuifilaceae bacterium]
MNINRENYETILVDYLDGKLCPEDEAELMFFLLKNPDIADEFEGLNDVTLSPAPMHFPSKSALKKHHYQSMGIDNEIEYLCIANLEGDLTTDEDVRLRKLSEGDESIRHIKTVFSNTKLAVPHEIIYPHKSNIKRLLVIPIRRSTFRIVMGAAASVAIMLGVYAALDFEKSIKTIADNQPNTIQSNLNPKDNNSTEKNLSLTDKSNTSKKVIVSPRVDKSSPHNVSQETLTNIEKQNLETIQALPAKLNLVAQVSPSKLDLPSHKSTINEIDNNIPQVYGNTKEYTLADIAKQGLKKVANSLGVEYEVKKNEDGKLKKLSIESSLLAFSTTKNKNDE